jgi:hypothetical protein
MMLFYKRSRISVNSNGQLTMLDDIEMFQQSYQRSVADKDAIHRSLQPDAFERRVDILEIVIITGKFT